MTPKQSMAEGRRYAYLKGRQAIEAVDRGDEKGARTLARIAARWAEQATSKKES